jgi:hypothetical protein
MSTGNAYGRTPVTIGEGVPVWRSVDPNGKWQGGGVIANLPAAGTVIASGHPVEINTETKVAKLANFFKVHATVGTGGGDTSLKIKVLPGLPRLKAGNYIGVPPAAVGGAMTCITVGAVTEGLVYDEVTIVGNSLGGLAENSLLTEGAANSTTVPYAVPNALVYANIYIEAGTTVATCDGVHTGTVYAARTPLMSTGVKTALASIKFDNSL